MISKLPKIYAVENKRNTAKRCLIFNHKFLLVMVLEKRNYRSETDLSSCSMNHAKYFMFQKLTASNRLDKITESSKHTAHAAWVK